MQALGCNILPNLWRWLAMSLGLPLEAPMEATRGWDISALQHGVPGLAAQHAAIFGLFCRSANACLGQGDRGKANYVRGLAVQHAAIFGLFCRSANACSGTEM